MSAAIVCPRCNGSVSARSIDLAGRVFYCEACKERWPLDHDPLQRATPVNPLHVSMATPFQPMLASAPAGNRTTVATPVNPLVPRPPPPSRPTPAAPAPPAAPGASAADAKALGSSWTERWDGRCWHITLRRVSMPTVGLVVCFTFFAAWWAYSQRDLFGDLAMVGVGVGVVLAIAFIVRLARWTYIRLDAKDFVIQQKPTGRSSTASTRNIARFALLDEGAPGQTRAGWSVGLVPPDGMTTPIDIDLFTEAEARFVAERLTEMLRAVYH